MPNHGRSKQMRKRDDSARNAVTFACAKDSSLEADCFRKTSFIIDVPSFVGFSMAVSSGHNPFCLKSRSTLCHNSCPRSRSLFIALSPPPRSSVIIAERNSLSKTYILRLVRAIAIFLQDIL